MARYAPGGVVVDGFLSTGLRAAGPYGGPPTSVTFADNVITAGVPPIPTEQFGIYIFLNAVARGTDNKGSDVGPFAVVP